jgi:uncharacterized protein YjbI with pentapeptide repeats
VAAYVRETPVEHGEMLPKRIARRERNVAKQEQLALLKRGAGEWNEWREKNPYMRPDLSDADLRGARLSGFHLYRADLKGANLGGANLKGADLNRAELRGANLRGARLGGANLSRADLSRADLTEANLSRTRLSGTVLGGIDLREVSGLENVDHHRPSYISIDTIYRSEGQIPEDFLRGAGVPDVFIEYMRSLVLTPLDYYTCLISYSNQDEAFAHHLSADLQHEKLRCWLASGQMKHGDKRRHSIDESIRFSDKLLLVLSEHSMTSPLVQQEVEAAFAKEDRRGGQVLFPLALDNAVQYAAQSWAGAIRRRTTISNFTNWKNDDEYHKALARLLKDLKYN